MAGLIQKYAASLLEIAKNNGQLEEFYRSVALIVLGKMSMDSQMPENLSLFLQDILPTEIESVMKQFVELAKEELHIQTVKIVSAVQLRDDQLMDLELRLIKLTKKRVHIENIVDESLIGGIRFVIGNMVVDNSIKTQLASLKEELYKGVYFKIESNRAESK